jgi:hypothetical protein
LQKIKTTIFLPSIASWFRESDAYLVLSFTYCFKVYTPSRAHFQYCTNTGCTTNSLESGGTCDISQIRVYFGPDFLEKS